MDRAELIRKRKGRCLAQVLEEFENKIEPKVSQDDAEAFKRFVRKKLAGLTTDSIEIMELNDTEINGHAVAMRDSLSPDSTLAAGGGSH